MEFPLSVEIVELLLEHCDLQTIRSVGGVNKFLRAVTLSPWMWKGKVSLMNTYIKYTRVDLNLNVNVFVVCARIRTLCRYDQQHKVYF